MAMDYSGRQGVFRYRRPTAEVSPTASVRGRVNPFPFDRSPVRERVPARLLPARRWSDPNDLQRSWEEAEELAVEVTLEAG